MRTDTKTIIAILALAVVVAAALFWGGRSATDESELTAEELTITEPAEAPPAVAETDESPKKDELREQDEYVPDEEPE